MWNLNVALGANVTGKKKPFIKSGKALQGKSSKMELPELLPFKICGSSYHWKSCVIICFCNREADGLLPVGHTCNTSLTVGGTQDAMWLDSQTTSTCSFQCERVASSLNPSLVRALHPISKAETPDAL